MVAGSNPAVPTMGSRASGGATNRVVTLPNLISLVRLAAVPAFLWLFLSGNENAGVAVYAVGAWTDFFDGYLARRLGAVSELGKLLDPLADRVFIIALCIALVGRGVLSAWLALAIVARDILVLGFVPILERKRVERIAVNFVGKSATAALLFGLTALAWSETTFPGAGAGAAVGSGFTVVGAGLYWAAAAMYAAEARSRLRALASAGPRGDMAVDDEGGGAGD